jgi:hypothetical protein
MSGCAGCGAIARFSEDVDITLDYRGLDSSFDPFAADVSNSQLRKFSDSLKSFVGEHAHGVVGPHFQERLATEFGGRNITEPNELHVVRPDIAQHVPTLEFPSSQVSVLSPARTFWEKATLMHVECQRGEFRTSAERLSRHWYDLAMLADLEYGHAALANRDLLADVVKHKKAFYNTSYANYDACLARQLRLLPDEDALVALRADFQRMIGAGMFIGEAPAFDDIVARLRVLEATING